MTDQAALPTERSALIQDHCKCLLRLGGRTRARTWDPLIKRHGLSIDISSEFFQLCQNPSIGHQRLTAKSPTMSARHRWQIEAWGRVAGAVAYRLKVPSQSSLQRILHDQARWHGHGTGDLPFDHRGTRGTALRLRE